MYCERCGAQNSDGSRFCVECGADMLAASNHAEGFVLPDNVQPYGHVRDAGSRGASRAAIVVGAALALLMAVVVAVLFVVPRLVDEPRRAGAAHVGEEKTSSPADASESSVGTASGKVPVSSVNSENDGTSETPDVQVETSPNTTDGVVSVGVQVRDSIAAYSWKELSQIAKEVEACGSRADALAVTQKYNLTGANGKLFDMGKSVSVNDGNVLEFRLVDVWHDEADTASGRAGLSFLATSCTYHHQMSTGKYTNGGWESSAMRSWLSSTIWNLLPQDLQAVIVPVYKWSNNVGNSRSTSCVTRTLDSVWLPSIVELSGNVAWEYFTEPQNANLFNAVFNAEGYQYEFFSQQGILSDQPNQVLALPTNWWLRSTAASTGRGRYVGPDGDPSMFGDSNENWGVVFGFCL